VVRVHDRDKWLQKAILKGVQLQFNIPEMKAYGGRSLEEFSAAAEYAKTAIDLTVWGGEELVEKVAIRIITN
jgi:hypothetical protein